ncbi:signal transduction histidine kinase [Methylopila jiangsuensis]|uniref:histidine kinase n=1 Tax=Methylopila jiangsuensis TaxID=586230 RepID=A0A9W6N3W9_9HYPH|nr:HWE histidine kinase domain-containing protein [Methylopila jiangsuensis]MDR6286887.1 light-regulated signal transduction histidine kinase (bacteriophytochrome)/CheY-like chemotaxis protein [Methylopila jiangsuensis]GLK76765.1 signal transduction histidine kinase [Methylopila jiangsuensis]
MTYPYSVDLTNCDREPIHIPGSIQPHGCLLACDAAAGVVLRRSENAEEMLSLRGEAIGRPLEDVIGPEAAHTVRNALAAAADASRPALAFDVAVHGRAFDVAVHRFKGVSIAEFEPAAAETRQPLELSRMLIGRIREADAPERLVASAARLVRAIAGYDRVMIYHMEADGSGRVVAEAKRPDLESFYGQYFPAGDIPQQARALYLRNTIRVISDASGARSPLVPMLDASGEPLDLSFAHLRSVSPIHCEYLRNMGVAASMSISIIVGGELWGLIACHHYSPRVLPMPERVAAEMFGEFFSLTLEALKHKRKLSTAADARRALDGVLRLASHHQDVGAAVRESLASIARLVPCDGVGLWMNGEWTAEGSTPPRDAVARLVALAAEAGEGAIYASHCLTQVVPGAEDFSAEAAGAMAVPLSQRPRDYLFFFRKELVQTLDWAGNPDKIYSTGPLGDRLTPRKSFDIWKETVRLQARPWSEADRETAEAARSALVEIALRHSELLQDERNKADVRQRMLNEELNHRVKNILAIIKSLVGRPAADGQELADYVTSLKGRIQALAFAHDQVVRGDGGGRLSALVAAEVSPYREPAAQIVCSGDDIWLDARAFSVMALVLHELSTNAAKYGALSRSGGRLDVSWRRTETGDCEILWRESGGPAVAPPTREGFGTVLVDRSIPYDLGGESDVRYLPDGVQARLLLPSRHVSSAEGRGAMRDGPASVRVAAPALPAETTLSDLSVLLVEDQLLIAMNVEELLAKRGALSISTSASAAEALRKLETFRPDVAVLDVNLGAGTSLPVAEALALRGVPFIFATGYGDRSMIPPDFSHVPVVRKPYEADALIAAILRAWRPDGAE